jgi:hypothetical protein
MPAAKLTMTFVSIGGSGVSSSSSASAGGDAS